MNRQAQGVVLLLLGGAVVKAWWSDLFLRYVKPGLGPFLLVAGVILIAVGVLTLVAKESGHHHEPWVGWLLLLPVIGLLLVAPPALGAYTADRSGAIAVVPDSDYPTLPAGDPVAVGLLDYSSRAIYDDGRSLTGRQLRLAGFLTPGEDGGVMLARIVMTCCAADGRPIKVGLTGAPPSGTSWVRVTGVYSPRRGKDPVSGAEIAYVEVQSWEPIAEPERPYEQ
ncbi:TIGR03943 family protein [Actinoplanes sp. NPDC051851]|uniref:TIGR03943 family putative permease subunit n=1 Tax=Actinoplanes sp. NPDC051851 TaxID=3154753 RepID=UPI00343FED8A